MTSAPPPSSSSSPAPSGVFVFLGPSLPLADARAILPSATYLPPVSMGDVYRLTARQPAVIAIVDGLFEQTPAVWHKEILFALSRGVRVLGASSMGALRAAELAAFGVEGVGEVFAAFHGGELEDDDEVAVTHAPGSEGYRSLSDAMVNIRAGLRRARAAGCIAAGTHDRLVAAAKRLYYPDRSWARLLHDAAAQGEGAGELAALRELIARERPDVKRADAVLLLRRLAAEEEAAAPGEGGGAAAAATARRAASAARFDFEPTYFWEQMILHEAAAADAAADAAGEGGVSLAALRRHVRLHGGRARDALGTALLLYLADEQAARRGLTVDVDAAALAAAAAPSAPGAPGLSREQQSELSRARLAIDALVRSASDQVNRRLPAALAHLGRLEPTLVEVRRKQAMLRALGLRAASPADAGATLDDLLAWYERRFGPIAGAPEAHAEEAGFTSFEEFVGELALEYMIERAP
jgi:hypothetical protein